MTEPNPPQRPNYRAEARDVIARLHGSTRRDRVAFVYGYVIALHAMANALPPPEFYRLHGLASALHDICSEDFR